MLICHSFHKLDHTINNQTQDNDWSNAIDAVWDAVWDAGIETEKINKMHIEMKKNLPNSWQTNRSVKLHSENEW